VDGARFDVAVASRAFSAENNSGSDASPGGAIAGVAGGGSGRAAGHSQPLGARPDGLRPAYRAA